MTAYELLGILAGVLDFVTNGIYIRSIVQGRTKPDRVTWWVLGLVSAMITISYYASGARETIWLPVAYTIGFLIIGALSLKYGEGPFRLNLLDRVAVAGALISGFVWWLVRSPVPALFMNMLTEFVGLAPTINKAYRRPWTEDSAAWILGTLASFLNVLAIREWTFAISAYPIYVFLTDAVIVYFILRKRNRR